jgi:hypothetical protein
MLLLPLSLAAIGGFRAGVVVERGNRCRPCRVNLSSLERQQILLKRGEL